MPFSKGVSNTTRRSVLARPYVQLERCHGYFCQQMPSEYYVDHKVLSDTEPHARVTISYAYM